MVNKRHLFCNSRFHLLRILNTTTMILCGYFIDNSITRLKSMLVVVFRIRNKGNRSLDDYSHTKQMILFVIMELLEADGSENYILYDFEEIMKFTLSHTLDEKEQEKKVHCANKNKTMYFCPSSLCNGLTCARNPKATCRIPTLSCDCIAEFYDQNGNEVDCKCKEHSYIQ